jgi:flavin-dependent dehydrogenase
MLNRYDVVVCGAGPGGLSAARVCAQGGLRVLVLDRRMTIGPKVCAGGITYHGLIQRVPEPLLEGAFAQQHLYSRLQRCCIARPTPIIATVDRGRLGAWMLDQAREVGVEILAGTRVLGFADHRLELERNGRRSTVRFTTLIGADGSNSTIRRRLGLATTGYGIGLNCQHQGRQPRMEWHLEPHRFGSGYGWIFPHGTTFSIGAYADRSQYDGQTLKQALLAWAMTRGVDLTTAVIRAGLVNYDFRGYRFGSIWLVGDAAGLASALTGEGIYPAIISGEEVARCILSPKHVPVALNLLITRHQRHRRLSSLALSGRRRCTLLMELAVSMLRFRLLDFTALEMAT